MQLRCLTLIVGLTLSSEAGRAADTATVGLSASEPAVVGLDANRLARIDGAVADGIQKGLAPGAVVLIVRQGKIAYHQAYGQRALEPSKEAMTKETIFDLASLTKPIATATSVMILLEEGKLNLADRAAMHLPGFGGNGKETITIEQLLLHTSGLIADNPIGDYAGGRETALMKINDLTPKAEPGTRFIYSDVGFMVLGLIVERLSGLPLDEFAQRRVFAPLGMRETRFKPPTCVANKIAPTEKRGDNWIRGEVHDPRAFALGGVAGHAGLFSTAPDLAVFAQMLINRGEYGGQRILAPETVRLMTTPRPVPGGYRALGWDVQTSYSSNRGEMFALGSFGHTGFTGTSIWIDSGSQMAVIFLSNRVHPVARTNVNRLRGQVATLAAASIVGAPFPQSADSVNPKILQRPLVNVLTGIDVLKRDGFGILRGKKVGLVTNHTGRDRDGKSTIDLLFGAPDVKLVALFSPEHGIRGAIDRLVNDSKDDKTGLPIYSLYGQRKRPSAEQLTDVEIIVYDIQDIGCRFYTYISTLGYTLEAAAKAKIKVVVLDRPNPIGGALIEGPVLDPKLESFTGYHPLPVRHGMTIGELATLFNRERAINADLQVIRMEGWSRAEWFDRTGQTWVNPSPNMRSLAAALLYPGIGLLETTNISVGRGTERPFEVFGAPWLDGRKLAESLAAAALPGVRFVPTRFTPTSSTHAGKDCGGVHIYLDDWQAFSPLKTGLTIACTLKKLYPSDWLSKRYGVLLAHPPTVEALERGESADQIIAAWKQPLGEFFKVRRKHLLYQ